MQISAQLLKILTEYVLVQQIDILELVVGKVVSFNQFNYVTPGRKGQWCRKLVSSFHTAVIWCTGS